MRTVYGCDFCTRTYSRIEDAKTCEEVYIKDRELINEFIRKMKKEFSETK